jgi:hypothetical protein
MYTQPRARGIIVIMRNILEGTWDVARVDFEILGHLGWMLWSGLPGLERLRIKFLVFGRKSPN